MVVRMQFLGATRMVTGSSFLLEHGNTKVLVDCGLIQAPPELLIRNRAPFPFDATELKAVVLTHAHLDHSGLVPRLLDEGFRGRILTTSITKDLLRVLWEDFVHLHQPARHPGAPRITPSDPALYTQVEVERALSRCEGFAYDTTITLSPSMRLRFRDAGHILGSAIVEIIVEKLKIVFSGDLGKSGKPIVRDPVTIGEADVIVLESTYGDRNHKSLQETVDELGRVISKTLSEGGTVLMPVYAIGRCQEVLYVLNKLTLDGILDRPLVFLDSPMAIQATDVYSRHMEVFDDEASRVLLHSPSNPRAPRLVFTESISASRSIVRHGSAIILAGSGMCEGGRIQDHLIRHLDDPRSAIILTGYQVEGTLGRRLVDGAKFVRIKGLVMPVKAQVHTINGLSAHADQQGLLDWVGAFRDPKPSIFLVHGESEKMEALAAALWNRYRIKAKIPELRELAVFDDRGRGEPSK